MCISLLWHVFCVDTVSSSSHLDCIVSEPSIILHIWTLIYTICCCTEVQTIENWFTLVLFVFLHISTQYISTYCLYRPRICFTAFQIYIYIFYFIITSWTHFVTKHHSLWSHCLCFIPEVQSVFCFDEWLYVIKLVRNVWFVVNIQLGSTIPIGCLTSLSVSLYFIYTELSFHIAFLIMDWFPYRCCFFYSKSTKILSIYLFCNVSLSYTETWIGVGRGEVRM